MQEKKIIVSKADITASCRAIHKPGEYTILPPGNRVFSNIPGLVGAETEVLAGPQIGANFIQYKVNLHENGGTENWLEQEYEQFIFINKGGLTLEYQNKKYQMKEGGFCWLPPHSSFRFLNKENDTSEFIWIRRLYEEVPGIKIPGAIISNEKDVAAEPVDTYMEQHLTPYEELGFDMGINIQKFDPGSYFSFVELHIMEHGLYMLYGNGIYWLNQDYIEVEKDAFIYMAPYCPQFFFTLGWDKAAYLLYKDVNRDLKLK